MSKVFICAAIPDEQASTVINIRFHFYMPAMAGICSPLNL